jgi:uncharacterized membrane protein
MMTTRPGRIVARQDKATRRAVLAAALLCALYASLSIRKHQLGLTAGYDLGIYEQAVRHLAHLELPRTLVNDEIFPRFIVALLAPFYALFPSPVTLLVAQAILISIGVIPLMTWAHRSLGTYAGIAVAIIYGIAPGVATAVGYDFHEVAFAVPLIAWSMTALGQEQWHRAVSWALPLALVKEDLGLTVVAAIGIYVCVRGERRLGLLTAVFGVCWTALTMRVALPALSKTGGYFVTDEMLPHDISGYLATAVSGSELKLLTVFALLMPTAFFALRSPLVLIALPTLVTRFLTTNENFWIPSFHYDVVLIPIVTAAFIHGLRKTTRHQHQAIIVSSALISTTVLAPLFDFGQLAKANFWTPSAHAQAIHHLVEMVPDDATVAASDNIVPQLTSRTTTFEFGTDCDCGPAWQPNDWQSADWIILDTRARAQFKNGNASTFRAKLDNGFSLVAEEHGIRLARRDSSS